MNQAAFEQTLGFNFSFYGKTYTTMVVNSNGFVQFAGHWQQLVPLRPLGDGLYEARIAPPRPGPLNLYDESASLGLRPGTLPHITLRAVEP